MNVLIRTAVAEDYDAVCALYAQVADVHSQALPQFFRPLEGPALPRDFFANILANEDATIFVAEWQDTLIGMIHCYVRTAPSVPVVVPRRFAYIEDLVVSEHFRHQGVGQTLIERVHQWAREQGVTEVELNVWEFNTSARSLYEKLGYQTTRRVMRKQLL